MSIAPPTPVCVRRPHTTWTTCPCDDCAIDRRRMAKLARNGYYTRVPSAKAAAVIEHLRSRGWTAKAIGSSCGLHYRTVDNQRSETYAPTVAARIVNHGDPTEGSVGADGTRRRLQGLARQGFDLQTISEAVGIRFSTLAAIRSGQTDRVRSRFYTAIRDYAATVEVQAGPSDPARQHAARRGWVGLLAWEDIDDPTEISAGRYDAHRRTGEVDEAVVLRLLEGERIDCTRAERNEAMRRWKAAGKSEAALCRTQGWKDSRYGREVAA